MPWVAPKGFLGTTVVSAGTAVRKDPNPDPRLPNHVTVVTELSETVHESELVQSASAPPDTSNWVRATLARDGEFPIGDMARGEVTHDLGGGLLVVKFQNVRALVKTTDLR